MVSLEVAVFKKFLHCNTDRRATPPDANDELRVKPVCKNHLREPKRILEQLLRRNVNLFHNQSSTPNQPQFCHENQGQTTMALTLRVKSL